VTLLATGRNADPSDTRYFFADVPENVKITTGMHGIGCYWYY